MTIQDLFIQANQALQAVISKVSDEQLATQLPAGMSRKPTTLGDAIRYHTYDDAWVPDVLAGKTKQAVGDTYDSLLTDAAVQANYLTYNRRAVEAVQPFTELERIVHLSYGDYPAGEYLQHIVSFRAFRAYDIAKLIGADTTMDPDYVQALLDTYSPVIDGYRQMGVFPPAVPVADDADPQTKLLAMAGRN